MTDEPFDFSKFLADASKGEGPDRDAIMKSEVADSMDGVMAEIAPRLWCIIQREMLKDPKSDIHLNAVINAAMFSVLAWLAACTPRNEQSDQLLRDKVLGNLEIAMENGARNAPHLAMIASNIGALKLLDDSLDGLSKVVTANSMIIKGVHEEIKRGRS